MDELEQGIAAIKLFLYVLLGSGILIIAGAVVVFCCYGYWRVQDNWDFLKKKKKKDKKLSEEIRDYISGRWYK